MVPRVAAGLARFPGVAPTGQTAAPGGRAGPGLPGVLPPQQAAASPAPHLERTWDAWQAGRYQRGEISPRPGYTGNPFRPR